MKQRRFSVNDIYKLMIDVFTGLGIPEQETKICADILIESDLQGIESHGVGRLKMYFDRIKDGIINPTTKITEVRDHAAIATWDGNNGMGQVIAYKAMKTAIEKAKIYGMGSVAVRNSNHYGIAGYYPKMAAEENMIGLTVTNARPSMAPTFGIEPMLGTNPIAFSAPSDCEFDFLFDGATSISQRGKIESLARADKSTPNSWVINDKAQSITDSHEILKELVLKKASFLPVGGSEEISGAHKGYGFSTIVEILSAALQTGSFMHQLSGLKNGKKVPYKLGHFFMAIDISAFTDLDEFKKTTGEIIRNLQNSIKAPGKDRIYVAGEKEYYKGFEIRDKGVPVNNTLLKNINIMIDDLDLEKQKKIFHN